MSGSPSEVPPFASLTLEGFVEELGRGRAVPGGGAAAAVCASLAAALVAMAARAARDLPRSGEIVDEGVRLARQALRLADDDAASYAQVKAVAAESASSSSAAIEHALRAAADVPLEISELASTTARWAAELVREGSEMLRGDALTGALVAEAVARSCLVLAQIDLASSPGDARLQRAASLVVDVHSEVEAAVAAARPREPSPSDG